MATVDPIVQCEACGAKLRLKAASLKVLKQVRCGKCQSMIEIPEVLKGDGPMPETPVLAKTPVADEEPPAVMSSAPSPAMSAPVPAPTPPIKPSAPVVTPSASAAPHLHPVSAVRPPAEPIPRSQPAASCASFPSTDKDLLTRIEALMEKVNAQQESIALLTAQLRQIVKAQSTAVATAEAILNR